MKVGLTISAVILFGLLGSLSIVPPLHAQDISTTPMTIQRDFALTVKLPFALDSSHISPVSAIQDPTVIQMFLSCWNRAGKSEVQRRIKCGELFGGGWPAFPPGCKMNRPIEECKPSDTFVFRGYSSLSLLTTTLIIVKNENCIGAYLLADDEAHGNPTRNISVTCGKLAASKPPTAEEQAPTKAPICIACPNASYSDQARKAKVPAVVPAAAPAPPTAPAPTKAGPPPEEVAKLQNQADQLNIRATTVQTSVESLRQQQHAAGFNLRTDISSSQERMRMYLAKGNAALKGADLKTAQTNFDFAEAELGKLENFLGR